MEVRAITVEDAAQINEWIAADPDHAGKFDAGFFTSNPGFSESFVVMLDGQPAMYVKAENVMRLHIQFSPSRMNNAKSLIQFIPFIEAAAKARKYSEIIFESVASPLKKFAASWGYHESPNEVSKRI